MKRGRAVIIGFLVVDAVALAVFLVLLVVKGMQTAVLDISLVPSTAKIMIGDTEYMGGAYRTFPSEKMNATIRAEGFDDKTIEVELKANETTRIRVYLMPSEGNLNYYAKNSDEAEKLATFNDEWVQKMTRLLAIQEILPITDFKYGGLNGKSSEIVINEISDCKAYLCLQAIGNFDTESQVDDLIVAKGFNPKDYEIKYEKR